MANSLRMNEPVVNQRLGPLWLAPGVTRGNVLTKFWATFVTIALLSGASILQGYLLTEHLNIPRGQQGTVSGEISFWVEIVAILLFAPLGVLADRIGRRPVYIVSMTFVAVGYALMPFATTANELLAFRLVFAVGMAGTAGTMATLTADYPREDSRGLMVGITSMCNTLGTIFVAGFVARIPFVLGERGFDPVTGGKAMYLFAAGLASDHRRHRAVGSCTRHSGTLNATGRRLAHAHSQRSEARPESTHRPGLRRFFCSAFRSRHQGFVFHAVGDSGRFQARHESG